MQHSCLLCCRLQNSLSECYALDGLLNYSDLHLALPILNLGRAQRFFFQSYESSSSSRLERLSMSTFNSYLPSNFLCARMNEATLAFLPLTSCCKRGNRRFVLQLTSFAMALNQSP